MMESPDDDMAARMAAVETLLALIAAMHLPASEMAEHAAQERLAAEALLEGSAGLALHPTARSPQARAVTLGRLASARLFEMAVESATKQALGGLAVPRVTS